MKFFVASFIFLFFSFHIYAQPIINTVIKASLPSGINESSGLETTRPNSLWTHNDSGGQPELYNIDTNGVLVKTLHVTNATNTDWEEVANDTSGNMFIGNFGNNNNDRQDLVIYKIQNPDLVSGNSVAAQQIHFSYPDQFAFPPSNDKKNFDMESMIAMNDSLYLFSKNRTTPYTGYSKLYRLPAVPGTYVAQLVDSFYTGNGAQDDFSLTGADITNSHDTLVLISHFRLWVFTGFTGTDFFNGAVQQFIFSGISSKKEGICFKSATDLLLTDEETVNGTRKLYEINLSGVLSNVNSENNLETKVFPNPFSNEINIVSVSALPEKFQYRIFDNSGRVCLEGKMENENKRLDVSSLESGIYFLELFSTDEKISILKIIKGN
jgi:hypothetical protein